MSWNWCELLVNEETTNKCVVLRLTWANIAYNRLARVLAELLTLPTRVGVKAATQETPTRNSNVAIALMICTLLSVVCVV